ncbi:MAG: xanthine dehydrogenase family protein subunit M [Rhodospirillales bacterium]|nr:xanthine dehydrogenase family protein subunit M [Rhodospirillales bacterium]
MKPFEYVAPGTADEAVAILTKNGLNARIIAGGTDYLVELKHSSSVPKVVVDVSKLSELKGIDLTEQGLRIGSAVTHSEIMASPLVAEHALAMQEAALTVGAVQTRNLGTLGGNLVTCVPSLDSGPVLVALDAAVTLAGPKGRRTMPLTEFFVGPRKTALESGELLVEILIPKERLGRGCSFRKFGLRKGQALALVNAAASLDLDKGKLTDVRIALGAVAPTVIRAVTAEKLLNGKAPSEDLFAEAADIAVSEAKPINDFRASADYRRDLIRAGTKRVLAEALTRAEGKS